MNYLKIQWLTEISINFLLKKETLYIIYMLAIAHSMGKLK